MPHPSFFEGWDSAPTACDLSLTPAAPSTTERTDDPHQPPFSQQALSPLRHTGLVAATGSTRSVSPST